MIMAYEFNVEQFKETFNAKSTEEKATDSLRLSHVPDNYFKLFPYKASGKTQAPIVTDLEDTVSGFFRRSLNIETDPVEFEALCQSLIGQIDIDDEDIDYFKEMIHNMFFQGDNFVAKNIGLYPYQTMVNNKSADRLAFFLYCVLGIDKQDRNEIEKAKEKYPFNVLEKMLVEMINAQQYEGTEKDKPYYKIIFDVQKKFRQDFRMMLKSGMTSIEDFTNLLSVYYFYYVSQTCLTLDQFCDGDRNNMVHLYFALDWEKVSKNRACCIEGWEKLQWNINHMFSHAITLEILNQHNSDEMYDYIKLQELASGDAEMDKQIAEEIEKAEATYKSYVGDYRRFDHIPIPIGGSETDRAVKHLYKCVEEQFLCTDRRRANQFYNEKFSEYCKARWVKNRKKSGLVLNLTERDIIFLTKISLRDEEKIRLNDLYKEYEYRGVFLDNTSKALLQEFFTKLNLIDKKSDSGDAQYVKRIL